MSFARLQDIRSTEKLIVFLHTGNKQLESEIHKRSHLQLQEKNMRYIRAIYVY